MIKEKFNKHLKEILIHDVEAAAFLIVAVSLTATLTSFAMNNVDDNTVKNIPSTNSANAIKKNTYNPVSVQVIDIDKDGFNDMIITHADGHIEHSFSKN